MPGFGSGCAPIQAAVQPWTAESFACAPGVSVLQSGAAIAAGIAAWSRWEYIWRPGSPVPVVAVTIGAVVSPVAWLGAAP